MIHRHTLGRVPAKPHTAFHDGDGTLLMEHLATREGFHGPFSILYYRTPPTYAKGVEPINLSGFCPFELLADQPVRRRHIRTQNVPAGGDFLTARRTLLVNDSLQIGVSKPTVATRRFFANGDGDELYFVTAGKGVLESDYGVLPFREHDYLLVPRSTPYRLVFEGGGATLLIFEGRPRLDIPGDFRNRYGQLTEYAPYSHRDFRVPTQLLHFDRARHGDPPHLVVVKACDRATVHQYDHFPHEVVGWDGFVYPVAFNIHDYQPKTGLVHLPPTIHVTFAGHDFVVCSFVPRLVDYHEKAVPCPYGHGNLDMDEVLYYVRGNFTSRKGIAAESISLHPIGIPHGPHPGTYEKSIGTKRTDELAVMCDAYKPFRLTAEAARIEDADYHFSWVR
jgi:homogentisate 1,2-dioxygenase